MVNKNIVSIEDRIPKLKQARKKKANRRLIFYLSVFFLLISFIIYLQSPLSNVHNIEVSGNKFISNEEITTLSGITKESNYWVVNKESVIENIEAHPEIKSVEVRKKFPISIVISITELNRIGYILQEDRYIPVLENGDLLTANSLSNLNGDAPLLKGFSNSTYLQEMAVEIKKLPDSIVQLISEISWQPKDGNPYKIIVYMNDGYEVEGSIRNFSNTMKAYPSVVSQLEPGIKGIIYISDGGAYFDPYVNSNEEEPVTKEDQDESEG
ncbi:cell division protein FtsQ/DivIB [Radiobacillus sp. PE A8.2]|uniref:cell division protein FtsQ/DivIB n=1 Tax=Radiobacillus sp. PE A8.2 TaxID=3380349 RepID=UPI00388D1DBF